MNYLVRLLLIGGLLTLSASYAADFSLGPEGLVNLESRYVEVDGITFHYVTKGEGPPLILLHGFPETWYSWRKNIEELALYFQVIALDLKGYGLSDKPVGDYSLPTLSREIADLIVSLGLERPILVGHDWGGFIAWDVARNYPQLLDKLIILNAPLHKRDPTLSPQIFLFAIPGMLEEIVRPDCRGFLKEVFSNSSYDPSTFTDRELDIYEGSFCKEEVWAAVSEYFEDLRAFSRQQWYQRLHRPIEVPTLVIWAENDPRQPVSLTEGMGQIVSDLKIEFIPRCGHFLQAERPAEVNRAILHYLLGDYSEPEIEVLTDSHLYHPGDELSLYLYIRNFGPSLTLDLFVGLITPDGGLFFLDPTIPLFRPAQLDEPITYTTTYPAFKLTADSQFSARALYAPRLPRIPSGTYTLFAALAIPGTTQVGRPRLVGRPSFTRFDFLSEGP